MPASINEQQSVASDSTLLSIPIYRLPHAMGKLPRYATAGSAGMDVHAAIVEPVMLEPFERQLIPTGLVLMLPHGYECQIRARSGLAIKHGITLINGIGTVDSDYRDEIKVPLVNLSNEAFIIQPGDRIAQLVIASVLQVSWKEVEHIDTSVDRQGGFGSTGL